LNRIGYMKKKSEELFDFKKDVKYKDIIHRFRKVRIEYDLIQKDFAEMLGIQLSVLKAIETGRISPSIDMIRKLHKRFKKSYSWILDGIEKP